jgi:hypothetical protein
VFECVVHPKKLWVEKMVENFLHFRLGFSGVGNCFALHSILHHEQVED